MGWIVWALMVLNLIEPSPVTTSTSTVTSTTSTTVVESSQLACIRSYEGSYTSNTGNGYYGAYQFMLETWKSVGGMGYPHQAAPEEQDKRAQMLLDKSGISQWGIAAQVNCG